jgi:phage terminase Nu1 subunit (DNA packaging protein)
MKNNRVSAVALGRHLDVSAQWIGKLVKAGVLTKLPDGAFDLDKSRVRYIRHLRDEVRRGGQTDATARAQEARARQLELKLAKEEGELLELTAVEEVMGDIIATFNSELIGVPAACSRDLEARDRIEEAVNGAIARCQKRFDQAVAALSHGQDPLADNDADES